jgi:hypothetical protein
VTFGAVKMFKFRKVKEAGLQDKEMSREGDAKRNGFQ